MSLNTSSINDRLGPGGLENVATLSTDVNGNTVLVGGYGNNYAALPLDPSGYPIANLIPRRNTLTELLTNTAGGVGEISEATDWDALVLHNGVVGGAKVLYCKPKTCYVIIGYSPLASSVLGTPSSVTFAAAPYDPHGLFNPGAPDRISVPAGANVCRLSASASFPFNAVGQREVSFGSTASDAGMGKATMQATSAEPMYFNLVSTNYEISSQTYFKLYAAQNSGSALSVQAGFFEASFWVR